MIRKVFICLMLLLMSVTVVWAGDFNHQAHLGEYAPEATCDTCHLDGAPSIVPDRAVCLECHDKGEVADVNLGATKTHGPVWALNHRVEAKGNAIDCAACHEQADCLECHKSGFAVEMGSFGNNMVNVHRDEFQISHPIAARTDQNLCSSCHESKFCSSCHDTFRLRRNDIASPSHRYTFDLGLEGYDFEAIHDGFTANKNCDACHNEDMVAPSFHDWQIGHAREARRSLATCQACHPDGDTCLKCHSQRQGAVGFNPHPKDWDDIKGRLKDASNGRTCRRCH